MDESITPARRACFELGIKFGSLYHQFAGTPVSPRSAESLERAIAESIQNQPYCRAVSVDIDRNALERAVDDRHGYTELTGSMMQCSIEVEVEGIRATARLEHVEGYPEMRIESITG